EERDRLARVLGEGALEEGLGGRRIPGSRARLALGRRLLRLAGQDRLDEAAHHGGGLQTLERARQCAFADRLHGRDAADLERLGEPRCLVDVHAGEHEGARVLLRELLEDRAELAARAAPRRPEIDHDRALVGGFEHLALEVRIADVADPFAHGRVARGAPPGPKGFAIVSSYTARASVAAASP